MRNGRSVLGIDAAWTSNHSSGVALAQEGPSGWALLRAAPSYDSFIATGVPLSAEKVLASGNNLDCSSLLDACRSILGHPVDLVAIDIPLSTEPIVARRASDDAVSRCYGGAKKCGTHSPNAIRPGPVSDAIRSGFERLGYPLCTSSVALPGLIEAYPHPALLELAQSPERLKYKFQKIAKYWPDLSRSDRVQTLTREWERIVRLLERHIDGISVQLPARGLPLRAKDMKLYEDTLDAVVCAWVGICALQGKAQPFGDNRSAIWIPQGNVDPVGLSTR